MILRRTFDEMLDNDISRIMFHIKGMQEGLKEAGRLLEFPNAREIQYNARYQYK